MIPMRSPLYCLLMGSVLHTHCQGLKRLSSISSTRSKADHTCHNCITHNQVEDSSLECSLRVCTNVPHHFSMFPVSCPCSGISSCLCLCVCFCLNPVVHCTELQWRCPAFSSHRKAKRDFFYAVQCLDSVKKSCGRSQRALARFSLVSQAQRSPGFRTVLTVDSLKINPAA